jgi:tripartite-type tricarboxylate transporter receptor subunit TctC
MKKKLGLLFAALLAAGCAKAWAQADYPNRSVKLVVPYSAGGSTDVLARVIGQRLSESLGQPFVVENRPGAGGIVATLAVVKSPADGYTLLVSDMSQVVINPFLFSKLPYDPVKDLAPVTIVATIPLYVVAQPSLGVDSLAQLIAMAKAKPGQLSYGSAGTGSIHHIVMESFKATAGLDIVHVPYKGSGQSAAAFVAGDLPLLITGMSAVGPHVKSGKGKLVAITSARRSSETPDVPSISEVVPGFDFSSEFGLLAPAGTPPAILSKIAGEVGKALKVPDTMQRLGPMGMEAVGSTPEAYVENIRRNLERFGRAVKISGAKAD